ncbi:hypothetical protein PMAA_011980 [Talaromyces marneffei ATCC 18224]|uniref:Uncharacterized protein n=2 Tax=Talaromyces marneffei TaxID=37727 RepID=B6QVB9_TALMQ|nr:hypothetical protein PMAA_011980 [Talaromyces marneffei ATCC 18224]
MSQLFKMDSNIWLRISRHLGTLLYYIVYPVILLLWSLSSLLLSLFGTILAPFVYVGGVSLYVIGAPFRFLAKFEPLYYFLGYAVLIGGVAGLLLCVTYRSIGQIFDLSSDTGRKSESPKFKRSYSADVTPDSDSTASEAPRGSKPRNQQSDISGKHNNRFTLSEFYADWMDRDDFIPSKESGIISSTIIEEEDDSQESWE